MVGISFVMVVVLSTYDCLDFLKRNSLPITRYMLVLPSVVEVMTHTSISPTLNDTKFSKVTLRLDGPDFGGGAHFLIEKILVRWVSM